LPLGTVEFERLYQEKRRTLLAYAYLCTRDLDLAEEIVQETVTIAFEKRDKYFPEADFGGWLISIARLVWFRERDRQRRRPGSIDFLGENVPFLFDDPSFQETAWESEARALRSCMEKLPGLDRDLIRAHFSEKRKYASIAESRDRSLSWVKVRMFRLRTALMECVQRSLAVHEEGVS